MYRRRLRRRSFALTCWTSDTSKLFDVYLAGEVGMQPGAVASKVVHQGYGLNVTVFGSTPANS